VSLSVEALRHVFFDTSEHLVGSGELETILDTITLRGSFRF